jgi:hypothetical protein
MGKWPQKETPFPFTSTKPTFRTTSPVRSNFGTVRALWNGHTAGATGLQAEHIKVWLTNAVCEEEEEGDIGLGYKGQVFVKLMQAN